MAPASFPMQIRGETLPTYVTWQSALEEQKKSNEVDVGDF